MKIFLCGNSKETWRLREIFWCDDDRWWIIATWCVINASTWCRNLQGLILRNPTLLYDSIDCCASFYTVRITALGRVLTALKRLQV